MGKFSKLKLGKLQLKSMKLDEMNKIKGGDNTLTIVGTTEHVVSTTCVSAIELYAVAEIDVEQ